MIIFKKSKNIQIRSTLICDLLLLQDIMISIEQLKFMNCIYLDSFNKATKIIHHCFVQNLIKNTGYT